MMKAYSKLAQAIICSALLLASGTPALANSLHTGDLLEDVVAVGSQTFLPTSVSVALNSAILSSARILAYDNVDAVLGPVSAVPEPSTLVYCLTGAALFATFMRRSNAITRRP